MAISIVEVLGFFSTSKIVDHPQIGRKKGVYYGLIIIFVVSLCIPMIGEDKILALFVAFGIIKFVVSMTFMVDLQVFRFSTHTQLRFTRR